jgi:hypothetical protein
MLWNIRARGRRRVGLLIGGVAVGLLGVTGVAPAATAAPAPAAVAARSCYIVCDGADPNSSSWFDENGVGHRCDDARTIYTYDPPNTGYVELRYSRECRMAWARGGLHGVMIRGYNADGSFRTSYSAGDSDSIAYTLAVNDAGLTARACIFIPLSGGQYTCGAPY